MKRTNIMLSEEQHRKLKLYSKKEGRTLGRLVRDAIENTYQKKDLIEKRRQIALNAYQEGLISLGKLAEVLGLDPVSARIYLKSSGITLLGQGPEEITQDVRNA